jgi:membrane protein implicated in regulation of membrane protease activity|tara:strand:- start:1023 stop:1346 length:324 start_codon:yes stop_codon:yes gene_type:complete
MDMYLQMSIWTFQPQIWVIVGLVFILLEMTDGSAIFFLPMGLSAQIVALWIYLFNESVIPLGWLPSSWYWLLVYWMILSVLTALLLSRAKKYRRSEDPLSDEDINNY